MVCESLSRIPPNSPLMKMAQKTSGRSAKKKYLLTDTHRGIWAMFSARLDRLSLHEGS